MLSFVSKFLGEYLHTDDVISVDTDCHLKKLIYVQSNEAKV
jgi:hypothetical protein